MQAINRLSIHPSPGGRPQPIAFHGGSLWVGCWDTATLYEIDAKTWSVKSEVALPDKPYGIASFGGALHLVIGDGEADDRYIYRFVPGKPFSHDDRIACPDFTGSHLATNGKALYLAQQTHRRLVELDESGKPARTIPFPVRSAGIGFAGDAFYMIAADDDFDVLEFATLDIDMPSAAPVIICSMNPAARGLAFDGTNWWTAHREEGEIVSFSA
jgi:hypothetical protein